MTTPEPTDEPPMMVAASGWCAPSQALYDLSVPDIQVRRGADWPTATPYVPPVPPTRWQRVKRGWRSLRERTSAVRYAAVKAWKFPDGWWEVD